MKAEQDEKKQKQQEFPCDPPAVTIASRQQRYHMDELNRLLPLQNVVRRNGDLGVSGGSGGAGGGASSGSVGRQFQSRPDFYPNPWVRRSERDFASGYRSPGPTKRNISRCFTEPPQPGDSSEFMEMSTELNQLQTTSVPSRDSQCLLGKEEQQQLELQQQPQQKQTVANGELLLQIIKRNFINYCQTTSLRGVPKIVKTNERLLKYIWIIFTFAFFFGCFTCLALIINQYLAYDVIHQPKTIRNFPVQFPSFTVCNTRPLSQDGIHFIHSHSMMLPKQYTSNVFRAIRNTQANMKMNDASSEFNETIKDALSTIFDTKGYYENVPAGINTTQFGHTLDQTILICESTILIKDFKRSKFCETIGTWTRTYDNKFLNCYTFTAGANYTNRILTVRIMAYTNERNLTYCPDCSEFPATQVSGLRVQLHNAGNYPEVQEEGLNIKPGSLTEIRFDTKEWMMKEPPHGRCSKAVPPSMLFSHSNFTYSYEACKKKVLHEQIMRKCDCLDSTIPLPDSMLDTGLHYCGMIPPRQFSLYTNSSVIAAQDTPSARQTLARYYNISADRVQLPSFTNNAEFKDFLRRVTCNMEIFKVAGNVTDKECFTPCTYYTYGTTISTTNWPTKAYLYEILRDFEQMMLRIDSLYRKGIMARNSSYLDPVHRRLKQIYDPVYTAVKDNPQKAEQMLGDIDYIQKNFIEILINRGKSNFEIERIEEKAVISMTSLLSQIGGLLSIWVGLTFVCIVEIVDMLYNIVTMYNQQRRLGIVS
ncbi:hypothetical protein BOX15_Mlig021130g3 [Macrostomum lignano]|uniref:FMRFamide-activated amiloride-sensitive sodium channel n=1 Tax=Macrostomum lignano TaxID=282301 RepID=A0A267FQU6_9PLAT|nr:hypothetical protein BOX15_Mlig021130g3 [Macrostomum lignano]